MDFFEKNEAESGSVCDLLKKVLTLQCYLLLLAVLKVRTAEEFGKFLLFY